MGFRFSAPLAANARMENTFKSTLFLGALQYYRAKFRAIQVAGRRINAGPKMGSNLRPDRGIRIDQLTGGAIGVKEPGARQKLTQTVAKCRFARGNAARDPDGGHVTSCRRR
ncbi:MAG: hypothetical protein QOH39_3663 [Verrucomicrobiota bacterium]